MITIGVSDDIFRDHPLYVRGLVVAVGIDNRGRDSQLSRLLEDAINASREEAIDFQSDPRFMLFGQIHRSFSTQGHRYRPLHETLWKTIRHPGETIRFSNKVEAIVRCAMLVDVMPVCADDLRAAAPVLELCRSNGTEAFRSVRGPNRLQHPNVGEFIALNRSTNSVIRRFWTVRAAKDAEVTESSTEVSVSVDAIGPDSQQRVERASERIAALLRRFCGAVANSALLTPSVSQLDVFVSREDFAADPGRAWSVKLQPPARAKQELRARR